MLRPGELVTVFDTTKMWYHAKDVGIPPCDVYMSRHTVGLIVAIVDEPRNLTFLLVGGELAWTATYLLPSLDDD